MSSTSELIKGLDISPTTSDSLPPTVVVGTPNFEALLAKTRDWLTEDGYEPSTIDSILHPYTKNYTPNPDVDIDISKLYKTLQSRISDADLTALTETLKIQDSLKNDGYTLGPFDRSQMGSFLELYARAGWAESLKDASVARNWVERLRRKVSEVGAEVITEGVSNLDMGLATLDGASWIQRRWKLGHYPKERQPEIEQRLFPYFTLPSFPGHKFTSGPAAALHLMTEKLVGAQRYLAGMPLIAFGKVTKTPGIEELGRYTKEWGSRQYKLAREEAPMVVASLGEVIPWNEMDYASEEEAAKQYQYWGEQHGGYTYGTWYEQVGQLFTDPTLGKWAFATTAFGNGLAEIFYDPLYLASGVATDVIKGARRLTPLGTQVARTTGIAQKSLKIEDAAEAVSKSEKFLEKAVKLKESNAKKIGSQIYYNVEDFQREMLARTHLAENQKMLDQYIEASSQKPWVLDPVRRSPETVPTAEEVQRQYQYASEVAKDLSDSRVKTLTVGPDKNIDWSEIDEFNFHQRYILGPDNAEETGDALNHIVRTGGIGIDDVTMHSLVPEYGTTPQYQIPIINWEKHPPFGHIKGIEAVAGKPKTVKESALRGLAQQEVLVRKNLGAARSSGDKAAIQFYETGLETIRKTMGGLAGGEAFDPSWLPGVQQGLLDSPLRYNNWLEANLDKLGRGLSEGSLTLLSPITENRLAQKMRDFITPFREPQRLLQTYDPETWTKVRDLDLRYYQSYRAAKEEVTRIFERNEIFKGGRTHFDPKAEFAGYRVDKEAARKLGVLLDTDPTSNEWKGLAGSFGPKIVKAHDELRALYDGLADGLRIPKEDRITGYFPHIINVDTFYKGQRPLEFMGLPPKTDVFFGHLLKRAGAAGYDTDAVTVTDVYLRGAFRKMYREPMYQAIKDSGDRMFQRTGKPILQDYMYDWANELQGRPTFMGKKLDRAFGTFDAAGNPTWRPTKDDRIIAGLTGLMWSGALVGNPRYPVMQIGTGVITTASRFGLFRTSRALWEMATPEGQAIARSIGVDDSFRHIFESNVGRKFTTMLSRASGIELTEFFIRGASSLAAADVYLNKLGLATWDDAVRAGVDKAVKFNALRAAEETNHLFGPLGRPAWPTRTLLPNRSLGIAATQFLSFIPKQTEELLAQFRDNPGRLVQYLALSGWLSRVAAENYGIDMNDYVGLGYLPRKLDEVTAPVVDVFGDWMNFLNAASNRDTKSTQENLEKFMKSFEIVWPAIGSFHTWTKAAERALTGEQRNTRGERVRGLNLSTERGTPGTIEALGPEVYPLATGQRSIRETLYREGALAISKQRQRKFYEAQKLLRDIGDAFTDGDLAKFASLQDRLVSEYGYQLVGENAIEKVAQARMVSDIMRDIQNNPVLAEKFMEEARKFGLPLKP